MPQPAKASKKRDSEAQPPTLYIIDGHSQLHRAFHALPPTMTSPVTGEPTNATFGFFSMLLRLLRERRPDYLAVAVDVSGDRGTFRSQLYEPYKATRPPSPEELGPQIDRCVRTLEAMGVPVLGAEGFEADDIIATIVEQLRRERPDLEIHIVSKDKDLQQLIDDGRVALDDPHSGTLLDEEALREKLGVGPGQVVDLLALTGDTVDNVPGVEGVGPKTAAQLLARYGSLENLLAHADEIKGKRGQKLRQAAATLPLSKQLVTLRRDAPIELDLERARVDRFDIRALEEVFRELGFTRLRDELRELAAGEQAAQGASTGGGEVDPAGDSLFAQTLSDDEPLSPDTRALAHRLITTTQQLRAFLEQARGAEVVAVDTETTGLSPLRAELVGVSLAIDDREGVYVPLRSPTPEAHLGAEEALPLLAQLLEDPSVPQCGHNLKFDLLVLRRAGVELRGIETDTLIASSLVDPERSSHSLDNLALAHLQHRCTSIASLIGRGRSQRRFDEVELELAAPYAAEDAVVALRLRSVLAPRLRALGLEKLCSEVETPLLEVLAEMEWNGVLVDPDELDRQAARLRTRLAELDEAVAREAPRPFNPDSPRQLAEILFNDPQDEQAPGLGVRSRKRRKTGPSTDVEVLEALAADPAVETALPQLILERRQLTKLISTYLAALKEAINPETGRIHASFHQTVAATGRLSSSDPNLQNIPIRTELGREIRKAFVAPPGALLIGADYSQIELRVLAHLSGDEALIEAFVKGEDIHRAAAARIHNVAPEDVTDEQRSGAKMVNFGVIYGVTPFGLARRLGVDVEEAAAIIDSYKERFPGVTAFFERCVEQAQRTGYAQTMLGRRRPVRGLDSRNPSRRAQARRIAVNTVVQGSAADLIKLAMLELHRLFSPHAAHWRRAAGMDEAPVIEGVKMILQIHDELLFEAPEERAEEARRVIVERMENAAPLRAPLVVDSAIGKSWWEAK